MSTPPPFHWLEISRSALLNNFKVIHRTIPKSTKIMAMVRPNAYGHGLEIVAPAISKYIDFFGVNTFEEALIIRQQKIPTPILIAAPISPKHFSQAAKNGLSLCVNSLEYLKSLTSLFPISM